MRSKGSRGVLIGSLALIVIGVVLLLNNFLLISGFNVTTLWPLLLVVGGATAGSTATDPSFVSNAAFYPLIS